MAAVVSSRERGTVSSAMLHLFCLATSTFPTSLVLSRCDRRRHLEWDPLRSARPFPLEGPIRMGSFSILLVAVAASRGEVHDWLITQANVSEEFVERALAALDAQEVRSVADLATFERTPTFDRSLSALTARKVRDALIRQEAAAGVTRPPSNDAEAPRTYYSFAKDACDGYAPVPRMAHLLTGSFRSFGDKRVHRSIRHHYLDALGAESTVFIYGKLDAQREVRGIDQIPSLADESRVRAAAAYLSDNHGHEVVLQIAKTSSSVLNPNCTWPAWGRAPAHINSAYVGQLQGITAAFRMLTQFEARHGTKFDYVARARLDTLWWRSVAPWCFLRPSTAYAFGDHYFLLPRNGSEALYNLHDDYMRCGNGLPPGHLEHNSENCCAGGPTALFVGVIRQHFVFRGTTEARPLGDLPTAQGKKAKFVAKDGSGVQYGLFTPLIVRSSENTSTKLKRAMHETLHLCKVLYERGTSRLEVGGPESGPAGFENDAQCLHVLRPYVEHRATTMVAEQATMVAEQAPWWQSPWLG